jgi:hypothetical protein
MERINIIPTQLRQGRRFFTFCSGEAFFTYGR